MYKRVLVFTFIILLGFYKIFARIEPPVIYNDARVMGMGGAFTAVADDKNMLFYNPAGFADYGLKKTSILDAIMDPTLWKPRYTNIGDLTFFSMTFGINETLFNKYGFSIWGGIDKSAPPYQLIDINFFEKFLNAHPSVVLSLKLDWTSIGRRVAVLRSPMSARGKQRW